MSDEQIAAKMGITRSTLNEWKQKYSDISDTLKRGKEVVDIQVENALLKRALGYESVETTEELSDGQMKVTKRVTKQIPPDTTAQIFWLKNRRPDLWRDKRDVELDGESKLEIVIADNLKELAK